MTQPRSSRPFLQAALNGDRVHPAAPHTPAQIAAEAVAVVHAEAIERTLAEAGVTLEQVHHGDGIVSWAVNRRANPRGHGIRTGLEDTPVLPDGRIAAGNGDLVAATAAMLTRNAPY